MLLQAPAAVSATPSMRASPAAGRMVLNERRSEVGFIGFLFLPYTTLAFVLMDNLIDPINGFGWFVVALGFLADVASYGGAAQNRRRVAA